MPTSRRNEGSDLSARVLAALPLIAFAIVIVWKGGTIFAIGLIGLGLMAFAELFQMMRQPKPPVLAGYLAVIGLVLAARFGGRDQVLLVLALSVPVTFLLTMMRRHRKDYSWAMAVVLLGIMWIGVALAHTMLLRKLPHGGGLLVDTLIGTFLGDTGAYLGGRMWGRTKLAPRISPNKTVE